MTWHRSVHFAYYIIQGTFFSIYELKGGPKFMPCHYFVLRPTMQAQKRVIKRTLRERQTFCFVMMTKKLRAAGFIKNARLRCQNDNSRDLTVILLFTTTEHHLFQVYILSLPSHTVRNLHFLSKNSTLIFSRKIVELFWVKTRENAAVLDF